MSLLEQGCTCNSCLENTKSLLDEAREQWNSGIRNIVFKPYHYSCGDGCCDNYGTNVYVNGFNLDCDGENAESVAERLMEFLEIDGVNIDFEYEESQ